MGKGLLNKLKIGLATLGLTSGISFGEIKAQKTTDYQTNDKELYEFYKQKQEILYMNYYEMEKDIQTRYGEKEDSIYDVYQNYYKKKMGVEDKNNSLEFFLPDSLMNSFMKKVDSLNKVFNPEKEKIYNNYKQKKDSISIQYNQKIYKDYQAKEDSVLENILEDFFGKYSIQVAYTKKLHRDGSSTPDSIVFKTPWNFLDAFDYKKERGPNPIWAWGNRELAKWLQSLGEEKRDSLKKSILEKEKEIDWMDLENARRRIDPNYPPRESVNIPGTDLYYFLSTWAFTNEELEKMDRIYMGKTDNDISLWGKKRKKKIIPFPRED
ncbi:MAG: hypothetical protein Q8O84_00425 [Nanoarchaeota archaeon]|nr:hypothetical protein [Nanoarchaeota archaeon]